jgi:hypothetical protein
MAWISNIAFRSIDNLSILFGIPTSWRGMARSTVCANVTAANGERNSLHGEENESPILWHIGALHGKQNGLLISDGNGFGVGSAPVLSDCLGGTSMWLGKIIHSGIEAAHPHLFLFIWT